MREAGYEIKAGKVPALCGKNQKRFIRLDTLGSGYGEAELRAVLSGKKAHEPHKEIIQSVSEKQINLLVDIQAKLRAGKGIGYERWAKVLFRAAREGSADTRYTVRLILSGGIMIKSIQTAACNSNIPPGTSGRNRLNKSSTYKVDGKTFIVEPVFQEDGHDTLGTILIKLMRADADRLYPRKYRRYRCGATAFFNADCSKPQKSSRE